MGSFVPELPDETTFEILLSRGLSPPHSALREVATSGDENERHIRDQNSGDLQSGHQAFEQGPISRRQFLPPRPAETEFEADPVLPVVRPPQCIPGCA